MFTVLRNFQKEWNFLINNLENKEYLRDENVARNISLFIKINEKLCLTVGFAYMEYFDKNFHIVIPLYCKFKDLIQSEFLEKGPAVLNYHNVKVYRAIRKNILLLLTSLINNIEPEQHKEFIDKYNKLLTFSLELYQEEDFRIREPEILTFLLECSQVFRGSFVTVFSSIVPMILQTVLPMITKDFSAFPEHRKNFFKLIKSLVKNCFDVFFTLPPEIFKTVIDCVIWAFKHDFPEIYKIGFATLNVILKSVNTNFQFAEQFYKFYYISILNDILFVLTDGLHKNGFQLQSKALYILLGVLQKLQTPLIEEGEGNNKEKVFNHILNIMS